jgi:hypothetical protein
MPRITFWKLAITAVCLSVFLFAFHAKLAQYDGPVSSVTPVKAARLWAGDSRIEPQEHLKLADFFAPAVLLFVAAVVLPLPRKIAPAQILPTPLPRLQLLDVQHFFRPPPAQ